MFEIFDLGTRRALTSKVVIAAIVVFTVGLTSTPANAFFKIGRIWSSTSTQKYPTVLSGDFTSGQISTANSMNLKWGGLANSTLQTGNLYVTSSITAYENAAFTMAMTDNYSMYGDTSPGLTTTCAGCNTAHVALNSRWIWSNQFLVPGGVGPTYFGYADTATVILHELGHAYGLDHPQNDPNTALTPAEIASVMYANYTIKRTPTADDISGIASMY